MPRMLVAALCVLMAACASAQLFPGIGNYVIRDNLVQTWYDADNYCRQLKGHLAYPETQEEADVIWGLMADYNMTQIHGAHHDQYILGDWYTLNGEEVSGLCWSQWADGYPMNTPDMSCGSLRTDGLANQACSDASTYICELPLWSDYDLFPSHGYYKYHRETLPWVEAMKVCESEGTNLLILNSEEELQALNNVYQWGTEVWVGIHHLHSNMNFITIFGESLDSTGYSRWYHGEPDGDNILYPYVTVHGMQGLRIFHGYWAFICEVEM